MYFLFGMLSRLVAISYCSRLYSFLSLKSDSRFEEPIKIFELRMPPFELPLALPALPSRSLELKVEMSSGLKGKTAATRTILVNFLGEALNSALASDSSSWLETEALRLLQRLHAL